MCRNHRGFVEALVAANRIGADVLLLNTSFAGPAMAEVIEREGADVVIYDQEFTATVERALRNVPDATRILGWVDTADGPPTLDALIDTQLGRQPAPSERASAIVLLDVGHHRNAQGRQAFRGSGGAGDLKAVLDRTPWRAEETIVIAAPMFHAWGFSQLLFAGLLACTIVTRRKFDAETTLELVDRHRATGLAVVPVMFDRIMDLPDEVRNHYSGTSLRFATASGSRMRPDVGHRVHGSVRRRDLQQLQRHRGGHDRHGDPRRPARCARHGGQARGWNRAPHPRRGLPTSRLR